MRSPLALRFAQSQSDRLLKLFGVLAILSFGLSELFYKVTFVSVWCFFAAALSAGLYFIFRDYNRKVIKATGE